MNTVEKVKAICKQRKIPISRLEKECGFANGYISQLKKGTIPDDRIVKIASFLNVALESLIDPDDIYYDGEFNVPEDKYRRRRLRVPIFGKVAAGQPIEAISEILGWEEISDDADGKLFGLTVQGDSMSPYIMSDDILLVRSQNFTENGDIVIAQVNGDQAACKKLMKHPEGISLISLNPIYDSMYFANSEIEDLPVVVMGVVVEIRRKVKRL